MYLRAHALWEDEGLSGEEGKLISTSAGRGDIAPRCQSRPVFLGKSLPESLEGEAETIFCAK